jgi:hypothetical protein
LTSIVAYLTRKPDVANAIATIASTIVALAALVVSVVSLVVAVRALKHQRHHNVLSVKPVPMVSPQILEEHIAVVLRNNGSGPLVVKSITVTGGHQPKDHLRACMPSLPSGMAWSTYVGPVKDQSLSPGDSVVLLELKGSESDADVLKFRDQCRTALGSLTVEIEYTDIYGSPNPPHRQPLDWYSRPR